MVEYSQYIEESQNDGEEKEEHSYNRMEEGVVNMLVQSKQMSIDNTSMDSPVIMFSRAEWEDNLFRWHRSIAQECVVLLFHLEISLSLRDSRKDVQTEADWPRSAHIVVDMFTCIG